MSEFRVTPSQTVEFTRIVRDINEQTATKPWVQDIPGKEFMQVCRATDELDRCIGQMVHYDTVRFEMVTNPSSCLYITAGRLNDTRMFELLAELNTLLIKIVKN